MPNQVKRQEEQKWRRDPCNAKGTKQNGLGFNLGNGNGNSRHRVSLLDWDNISNLIGISQMYDFAMTVRPNAVSAGYGEISS